jgi:hypothetical protein
MIIHDAQQGSAEWLKARSGIPTASCFSRILTAGGKKSDQRTAYAYQLAGERLLGCAEEGYVSKAMERGTELEFDARDAYEFITDIRPTECGLVLEDGKRWGCSPDALCGEAGGLELKCPGIPKHVEYLLAGKLPTGYFCQVQGCLFVTGREWWDFASYYPGLPIFIHRVEPDREWHEKLEAALVEFCAQVDEYTERLMALKGE